MSTGSTADDPNPEMMSSPAFIHSPTSYKYAITHVFLPVELPRKSDYSPENDLSLACAACAAAHAYATHVNRTPGKPQWCRIQNMLDNLQAFVQSERLDKGHILSQLRAMQMGGTPTSSLLILC